MPKLAGELELLLEGQDRFEALRAATLRRAGRRVVDLAYANPYEGPAPEVRRALALALEERELSLQYTPYGGHTTTRRLIAAKLGREFGLPFTFRDVILTPGAMAALNVALRALFGPEDEVLVPMPCWFDYPLYARNLGIPVRLVPVRDNKHLDLAAIGDALTARTRGVLFSHPCCPTGVVYSPAEIRGLAELLTRAERRFGAPIYLISDEVHRDLVWGETEFESPLARYPRSLLIYSFGKALALQGQRIGYVAVSAAMPERVDVREQLERCVRMMGFCAPTALMQRAICRLLDYRPPLDRLAALQHTVRSKLKGLGYEACDAEATFFVYVKSPIADDLKFVELLAAHGVLVLPSTLFHEPGHFRLSLTARPESLVAALPVFDRALAEASRNGHA